MKVFFGAVTLASLTLGAPVFACSICRCGDPTFNALGKEGVSQTGLRVALDWDEVRKTQGAPGEDFEKLREERTTALFAYGFSDRVNAFLRVPYSVRELTQSEGGGSEPMRTSGLADPEIYGQVRLWSSRFEGDVGLRGSVYAVLGVKTDWGSNRLSRDGQRLDEHLQPGTGSTDGFGGLAGSYQVNPRSAVFASVQYRHTGSNDFGYRYGRVTLANLAYEHKLATRWDAALEANFRHAGVDRTPQLAQGFDPDTGGRIFYATPRLLFDAGRGWVVRASAQIPLGQGGLNGLQREKTVVNVGLTRLLGASRKNQG